MTKYIDPKLSQDALETYQGYSIQVFTSGRIKLSFHKSHKDKVEYYEVKPKRSWEAYKRQYNRSATAKPEHYLLIEKLLAEYPCLAPIFCTTNFWFLYQRFGYWRVHI